MINNNLKCDNNNYYYYYHILNFLELINNVNKKTWLWSVGNSPLSQTSSGSHFNEFQIDITKRNQIVHSLDKSIETFNRAVNRLSHLFTSYYFLHILFIKLKIIKNN